MTHVPINLAEKLSKFEDRWSPKVIAELNDYQLKLAKLEGEFVWHDHAETDELFLVLDGRLVIEFRDGKVQLGPGEMFVVPRGVEHKPFAEKVCHIMLIEPRGVINTGRAEGATAAPNDVWI